MPQYKSKDYNERLKNELKLILKSIFFNLGLGLGPTVHLQVVTPCGGQFISGVKVFRDTGRGKMVISPAGERCRQPITDRSQVQPRPPTLDKHK